MIVKQIKIPDPPAQDLVSLNRLDNWVFGFDRESFMDINNKKSLILWSGSFIIYLRNAGTKKPEYKTPELGDFQIIKN